MIVLTDYEAIETDSVTTYAFPSGRIEFDGERYTLYMLSAASNHAERMVQLRLSHIGTLCKTDEGLAMRFDAAAFDDVARAVGVRRRQLRPTPIETPIETRMTFESEYGNEYKLINLPNGLKAIECEYGRIFPQGRLVDGAIEYDNTTKLIAAISSRRELSSERLAVEHMARCLNYGDGGEYHYSFGRESFSAVARVMKPRKRDN